MGCAELPFWSFLQLAANEQRHLFVKAKELADSLNGSVQYRWAGDVGRLRVDVLDEIAVQRLDNLSLGFLRHISDVVTTDDVGSELLAVR